MIDRMKKDLIAMKLADNELAESLWDKQQIVKDQFEKAGK